VLFRFLKFVDGKVYNIVDYILNMLKRGRQKKYFYIILITSAIFLVIYGVAQLGQEPDLSPSFGKQVSGVELSEQEKEEITKIDIEFKKTGSQRIDFFFPLIDKELEEGNIEKLVNIAEEVPGMRSPLIFRACREAIKSKDAQSLQELIDHLNSVEEKLECERGLGFWH
jgi:hypothetical protein